VIAFLPVARYRVDYQVASGRPFSSFERLLLTAIHQGNATLDSLADLFRLHRRMVIEGIVTLMQAGWVCIGTDGSSFVTTDSGRLAAERSGGLPATIVVTNKTTTLLFEKVSGQLARNSDLDLYTKQRLERLWTSGVAIPPNNVPNIIEPGMIAHLLPHEPGEWVRLIGPINVVADNRLYAIVDVDSLARTLTGVPQAWRALLTDDLVTHVLRAEARLASAVVTDDEKELKSLAAGGAWAADASAQTSWGTATLSSRDILATPLEHAEALRTVLCGAQSSVVIVSSALAGAVVESVMPDFRSALERDLLISVLWCAIPGDFPQEHARGLDLLKKLEYDSSHGQCVGRLVVNTVALGGSFNVLISDPKDGIEVIFGSFAWLRSGLSSTEKHLSIRLCRSSVGARFCDFAADLATKDERIRTSSAMTSLRKLAARLRSAPSVAPPPAGSDLVTAESNVFFDEAVGWYVGETITDAADSIYVAVDHLPEAPRSAFVERMSAAGERIARPVLVDFGGTVTEADDSSSQPLRRAPIFLSSSPEMKANLVVVDSISASVGNRSWFGESKNTCRPYGDDVALALRGAGVAQLVLRRMGDSEAYLISKCAHDCESGRPARDDRHSNPGRLQNI